MMIYVDVLLITRSRSKDIQRILEILIRYLRSVSFLSPKFCGTRLGEIAIVVPTGESQECRGSRNPRAQTWISMAIQHGHSPSLIRPRVAPQKAQLRHDDTEVSQRNSSANIPHHIPVSDFYPHHIPVLVLILHLVSKVQAAVKEMDEKIKAMQGKTAGALGVHYSVRSSGFLYVFLYLEGRNPAISCRFFHGFSVLGSKSASILSKHSE